MLHAFQSVCQGSGAVRLTTEKGQMQLKPAHLCCGGKFEENMEELCLEHLFVYAPTQHVKLWVLLVGSNQGGGKLGQCGYCL